MRAGRMREPATIQQRARVKQPDGSIQDGWVDKAQIRAEIQQTSAVETLGGQQIIANATFRVVTRWFDGITSADRILYNDGVNERTLEIVAIANVDQRRTVMEMICREAR